MTSPKSTKGRNAPPSPSRCIDPQELLKKHGRRIVNRIRYLDLRTLVPADTFRGGRLPPSVAAAVTGVLEDYLAEHGWYWRQAEALVGVAYPNLGGGLLEFKHNALVKAVEQRLRNTLQLPEDKTPEPLPARRVVDRDTFFQLCRRLKARPERIHILDLAEILFGGDAEDIILPRRVGQLVDRILDDYLKQQGYALRLSDTRILLLFPNLGKRLGEMKRDTIGEDIKRQLGLPEERKTENIEERLRRLRLRRHDGSTAAPPSESNGAAPTRSPATEHPAVWNREQQILWDQAVEAMAKGNRHLFDGVDPTALPEGCTCLYMPVWRRKGRMLTGHLLQVVRQRDDGGCEPVRSTLSDPFALDGPDPVDLPALAQAIRSIQSVVRTDSESLVVVPVNFHTLERERYRQVYLQLCSRLDARERAFLVLELVGVPHDLAPFLLEKRVAQLVPYCRAVLGRADLRRRLPSQWRNTGVHAVGVDLDLDWSLEKDLLQGLDRFTDRAGPLHTYVLGLRSRSLATGAIAAGFDYLCGAAVAPGRKALSGVQKFDTWALYR